MDHLPCLAELQLVLLRALLLAPGWEAPKFGVPWVAHENQPQSAKRPFVRNHKHRLVEKTNSFSKKGGVGWGVLGGDIGSEKGVGGDTTLRVFLLSHLTDGKLRRQRNGWIVIFKRRANVWVKTGMVGCGSKRWGRWGRRGDDEGATTE